MGNISGQNLLENFENWLQLIDSNGRKVSLLSPTIMKLENMEIEICGELYRQIYGPLGVSSSINNKVFKTSPDLWREFISKVQIDNLDKFKLGEQKYLVFQKEITNYGISTASDYTKNYLIDMIENIVNRDADITALGMTYTFNILDKENSNVIITPEILINMDFEKGIFDCYSGYQYIDENNKKVFVCLSKPNKKSDLESILAVHIDNEFLFLEKMIDVNKVYLDSVVNCDVKISIRELIDILKRIKCKFVVDQDGFLSEVNGLKASNSFLISNTINSLKIPFKSLKKLSSLRKSLKKDSMNLYELLILLTSELGNPLLNLTGSVFANLCQSAINKTLDWNIIEDEL